MRGRFSQYLPNMGTWRSLAKASMWPPTIVVSNKFINCLLQMLVAKYEPVIETFVTDGPHPRLGDCISLGRFHWSADLSDSK
jgi:hypothetical protein